VYCKRPFRMVAAGGRSSTRTLLGHYPPQGSVLRLWCWVTATDLPLLTPVRVELHEETEKANHDTD
jgi:hypothetical protein